MIKYLGSKRVLVPAISEIVTAVPGVRSVVDAFAGTTRVGQALKREGLHVLSNDLASYSEALGLCYVAADAGAIDVRALNRKLELLSALAPVDGYVTETFCRASRYFHPTNGMRIDAIRPAIDEIADDRVEWGILMTSLLEAADRVDSTTGLQMAYLKQWAPRAHKPLTLRLPTLVAGRGAVADRDALDLARSHRGADLWYLDPPYNQHSYFNNYHVWETIVRNDEPEHYGVACKRVDCRERRSAFNSKRTAWDAFTALVHSIDAPHLLVSFSNESFFTASDVEQLLAERAETAVASFDNKRYVGAQIGIHDPRGRRVGEVSHLRNTEHLFLCGAGARDVIASTLGNGKVAAAS